MGKQESCLSNHTRFARIWKLFEKTQDLRGYEECLRKQKTCEDTIGNIKIVWQHTRLARIPAKNMKLVWQNTTLDEHFKTNISRRTFQDEHYKTNTSRRACTGRILTRRTFNGGDGDGGGGGGGDLFPLANSWTLLLQVTAGHRPWSDITPCSSRKPSALISMCAASVHLRESRRFENLLP